MAGANWADLAFDINGKRVLHGLKHGEANVGFAKHSVLMESPHGRYLIDNGNMTFDGIHVVARETLSRSGVIACVWVDAPDKYMEPMLGFVGMSCYGFQHNGSFGITPAGLAQFWYQILDWVEEHEIPECFAKLDLTQAAADLDVHESFRAMLRLSDAQPGLISSLIPTHELTVLLEDIPTVPGYDRTQLDKLIARARKLV